MSHYWEDILKPPPCVFVQRNIGEVSEGRRGLKNSIATLL